MGKKETGGGKNTGKDTPLWDATLSAEERIRYLLGELTLEEKLLCLGTGNPAIERLGIPAFGVGGEAAHGVQARHDQEYDKAEPCFTTVFPNPIGMSATWDRELIREAGNVVGREARALYHSGRHRCLSMWAPTVDLNRDPRWGRLEECYGEDGFLTGEMAGAYVDGMQGEGKFLQCAATAKHFYANNKEAGRTYESSYVDWRNKYEYYLEPFRKLIQEHRLEGVMAAYNEVNGVPCMLLGEDFALLKKWGLGHVVCDGGDVGQTVDFHRYFSRHSETIAAGLHAHVDCFTDDINLIARAAGEALRHGMICEEDIDAALASYFRTMLRLGFFDRDGKNPYTDIAPGVVSCRAHRETARRITAESVVLLKNEPVFFGGKEGRRTEQLPSGKPDAEDGGLSGGGARRPAEDRLLPLSQEAVSEGTRSLAVIGPLSDAWDKDWYSGQPRHGVTPWEGICEAVFGEENATGDSLRMETGIPQVKIRLGMPEGLRERQEERYLGLREDGITLGAVPTDRAETFLLGSWEHGRITLKAASTGKYLTLRDDREKGEEGTVAAASDEAFGWFVREMFHMHSPGEVTAWDGEGFVLDGCGVVKKKGFCPEGEGRSFRWEIQYVKDGIRAAAELAGQVDQVILCLGAHPIITCKEEVDRQDLQLAEYQQELMERVVQANPRVVLALLTSVPFDISWAQEHVPAIATMAAGSMELGRGLADVLFGRVSPAGRLPVTWYRSERDLPPMEDYDVIGGGRTYQYFQGNPLYPFGYGLSYSSFGYLGMQTVQEEPVGASDRRFGTLRVTVQVRNEGPVSSDEVVQVYGRKVDSEIKMPVRKLLGFQRLKDIAPGEEREVSFRISQSQLAYYDVISREMKLEPGIYEIQAGASSADIRLREEIVLAGQERGVRDGEEALAADCYDSAKNHILRPGHLSWQAVCSKNGTDETELTYQRVRLREAPRALVLDFWREYRCEISVLVNGERVGAQELADAFDSDAGEALPGKRRIAGAVEGDGAFQAHQAWYAREREIGFREITIPLEQEKVPAGELFTLTIAWKGRGKLCMFYFA